MLQTRINGESPGNNHFEILNELGEVVASISTEAARSINFKVDTKRGYQLRKANGWVSKPK